MRALSKAAFVAAALSSSVVFAQESEPSPAPPPPPPASSSNVFNPDISVIGNFVGALGDNDVDPAPTLDMEEAEVALQAAVDPYARGDFYIGVTPEGAELEEAFVTFTSLPGAFLLKGGKMKAAFGKVNTLHFHQMPWVDRPLLLENLLGGEEGLNDSGLSLSRLFPNDLLFLEATAEVYAGDNEVFAAPERSDVLWVGRVRAYRDVTESTNLDVGGSFARGHNDAGDGTTTRLVGADVTLRWRPLRRAIYRRLLARAEAVWSRREQEDGTQDAFGAYVSTEYQFARRWYAGVRFDWSEHADDASARDTAQSALLTFWPSEFSQVRGQFRRLRYGSGDTAHELLVQLQFSIGAHGAHTF